MQLFMLASMQSSGPLGLKLSMRHLSDVPPAAARFCCLAEFAHQNQTNPAPTSTPHSIMLPTDVLRQQKRLNLQHCAEEAVHITIGPNCARDMYLLMLLCTVCGA